MVTEDFIFISHASVDKADKIRPIVEVLLQEGEPIWIDRPGVGDRNFGFNQAFIDKNKIDYLMSGELWSESIESALRSAGAVLGCLSSNLTRDHKVLRDEIVVAKAIGKFIPCIVDEISRSDLNDLSEGLFKHVGDLQAIRLDPLILQDALRLKEQSGKTADELPIKYKNEWEKVRNLIGSINRVRESPRSLRVSDIDRLIHILSIMRHGPILKIDAVPDEIIDAFSDFLGNPKMMQATINQTNRLVKAVSQNDPLIDKLTLRPAKLPPFANASPETFWTRAFALAGLTSRRTLASMISVPAAVWAFEKKQMPEIGEQFLETIKLNN